MEAREDDANAVRAGRIEVRRSARWFERGAVDAPQLWLVLHGYGQLASAFLQSCAPLAREGRRLVAPEALSRFYLRSGRGAIGGSWMTAWRWASRARRAPQCVVACGGGLPPDLDLDAPALRALEVVLSAGEHDEAYTPHAAQHDAERLVGRVARCEVALHAGGHELDLELLARL